MRERFEISRLLEELEDALRAEIAGLAVLRSSYAPGLPEIAGDREKLRALLVMLVKNAALSLRRSPGTVHVETGLTRHDGSPLKNAFGAPPRPATYVFVEISDPGVDSSASEAAPAERDPMRETVPAKHQRRGLSFAAALGVVRRHGGVITTGRTPSGGGWLRVMMPSAGDEDG